MKDTADGRLLNFAVEEIGALRAGAAYEAGVLQAHTGYTTFPKSRRGPLEQQVRRLHDCAVGDGAAANKLIPYTQLDDAMRAAGARTQLHVPSWTAELPPLRPDPDEEQVPFKHLSLALDEIWALRRQLAYEAVIAEQHGTLKTFPSSRRAALAAQVERMRACARGEVLRAYAGKSSQILDHGLTALGAPAYLNRERWLAQVGAVTT